MSGPRILLVDDEGGILSALKRTLRREGYEIRLADSTRAALRVLDEEPVALVLSDQKMPDMSGLEFLREAARRQPKAVRLLITGWPEEVPPEELRKAGIHALLPKPWDPEILKKTLREALQV